MIYAIEQIQLYIKDLDFSKFCKDQKTIDAVIRNFEVLGEAARNLPDDIKSKHSEIPWSSIIGMKNLLIHEYFGVNNTILWNTATVKLKDLLANLTLIKL